MVFLEPEAVPGVWPPHPHPSNRVLLFNHVCLLRVTKEEEPLLWPVLTVAAAASTSNHHKQTQRQQKATDNDNNYTNKHNVNAVCSQHLYVHLFVLVQTTGPASAVSRQDTRGSTDRLRATGQRHGLPTSSLFSRQPASGGGGGIC